MGRWVERIGQVGGIRHSVSTMTQVTKLDHKKNYTKRRKEVIIHEHGRVPTNPSCVTRVCRVAIIHEYGNVSLNRVTHLDTSPSPEMCLSYACPKSAGTG